MKKSELKTGMVVVFRNGSKLVVMKDIQSKVGGTTDALCTVDYCNWHSLSDWNGNLNNQFMNGTPKWDIVEVIELYSPASLFPTFDISEATSIWKRQ